MPSHPLPGGDLFLGSVSHLPAADFVPCLRSLRQVGFDGHVCLFSKRMTAEELERLRPWADEIIEVDPLYDAVLAEALARSLRAFRDLQGVRAFTKVARRFPSRLGRLGLAIGGLQSLRYLHYRDFLTSHRQSFSQVILSDVRDVLFQRHPFRDQLTTLEVFIEEPDVTMGRPDSKNREWYAELYGEAGVASVASKVVSCSGVTVGPMPQALDYVTAMAEEIERQLPTPLAGHDQAIHNHLLLTGRLEGARRVTNGTGRVLTMGMLPRLRYSPQMDVLNADGSVPSVLHQYDRHPADAPRLIARLTSSDGALSSTRFP